MKKFGNEKLLYPDLNNMFENSLSISGLNLIRELQDRDIDFSAGTIDWFGDAYVDADGREDSVDTGNTTATFDTENIAYATDLTDEASGDSTHDPDSFTNPGNAFDGDDGTYASKTTSSTGSVYLGKTFSAKNVKYVKIHASAKGNSGGGGVIARLYLETYNGSTWNNEDKLADDTNYYTGTSATATYDGFYELDKSVQGVRLRFYRNENNGSTHECYLLEYGDGIDAEIYQDISSGTFNTTISTAIGVPFINMWQDDSNNIQYKLTNTGGDDSGWLSCSNSPEISSFTAFSNGEPDTLIIKLAPNSGGIQLKGFCVRCT